MWKLFEPRSTAARNSAGEEDPVSDDSVILLAGSKRLKMKSLPAYDATKRCCDKAVFGRMKNPVSGTCRITLR
jgi:hypothetical protein